MMDLKLAASSILMWAPLGQNVRVSGLVQSTFLRGSKILRPAVVSLTRLCQGNKRKQSVLVSSLVRAVAHHGGASLQWTSVRWFATGCQSQNPPKSLHHYVNVAVIIRVIGRISLTFETPCKPVS